MILTHMDFEKSITNLLIQQGRKNGKLAVALLAGIALGGLVSSLFSSKSILNLRTDANGGGKTGNLKNSYTEMSNRLAN